MHDDGLRKTGIIQAVKSDLPILKNISTDKSVMVKAVCHSMVADYLELYYPGGNSTAVALEFINVVFDNYYLWTPLDFQAFINFIKLNKPETSGHKILPNELIESVKLYESEKCELIEKELHNKKVTAKTEIESMVIEKDSPLAELSVRLSQREDNKKHLLNLKVVEQKKLQLKKDNKWNDLVEKYFPNNGEGMTDEQIETARIPFTAEWTEFLQSIK